MPRHSGEKIRAIWAVFPWSASGAVIERCDEYCRAPIEAVEGRFENINGLHPRVPYRASWTLYRIQIAGNHQSFGPDAKCPLNVVSLARVHHDDQIGPAHISRC
jgi:hypothetical protein